MASSIAYGEAQGLDPQWLADAQRFLPRPALTIVLDIAPETAVRRKSANRDRYERDLALLLPGSPLSGVMETEVWGEIYDRLTGLIESHRTTLVFVNTRRLAERVARHLAERIGEDAVTSHHGSLAKEHRLRAYFAVNAAAKDFQPLQRLVRSGKDLSDKESQIQDAAVPVKTLLT